MPPSRVGIHFYVIEYITARHLFCRVYVSDSVGNVIALDSDLKEVWRLDVGEPLTDSVTGNGVVIGIETY